MISATHKAFDPAHVRIMLITHGHIGSALVNTVVSTFGHLPIPTSVITVSNDCDPTSVVNTLQSKMAQFDPQQEILILTDLYGSTPSNIAKQLQPRAVHVISGLNLPMLIRLMNYPTLTADELAQKALTGGRDGIRLADQVDSC